MWQGEPNASVVPVVWQEVRPVPAQMWQRWAQSRRRHGEAHIAKVAEMLGVALVPLASFGDAHAEAQELIAAPLKVELG